MAQVPYLRGYTTLEVISSQVPLKMEKQMSFYSYFYIFRVMMEKEESLQCSKLMTVSNLRGDRSVQAVVMKGTATSDQKKLVM